MKEQIKISKVKGNPKNPRIIKNDKFRTLKNSIRTMPGYMKLRPVIIDKDMMVLGGNMRLKASIDLGKKEIWTDMFTQADCDDMNKIAIEEERETKTYLEYCDAIIIKDNVSSGEWEWDILANDWDSVLLNEYGLDVWENKDDVDYSEKNKEIDIDALDSDMIFKLKYTEDEYTLVREQLSKIASTPEQAVWKLLGNE
jgi:hypothetical protein